MPEKVFRQKKVLRSALRARRREAASTDEEASISLCDVFMTHLTVPKDAIVGAYVMQGSEMDPAPLVDVLRGEGFTIALPCVAEIDGTLLFRPHEPGGELELGPMDIPQPVAAEPFVHPDILIVPLLGFDRKGNRLGQGRGYYDRYLGAECAKRPLVSIGIAYAAQEEDVIPASDHDHPLDYIVTEKEFIDPSIFSPFQER